MSNQKEQKKRHPDYGLQDQARGRCPYCLASADMDCDCEKTNQKEQEWEEEMRGLIYIPSFSTDTEARTQIEVMRDFVRLQIAKTRQEERAKTKEYFKELEKAILRLGEAKNFEEVFILVSYLRGYINSLKNMFDQDAQK